MIPLLSWLHPLLFGLWPILLYYNATLGAHLPEQMLFPAVATLLSVILLMAVLRGFYHDDGRSGVMAALLIVLFYSSGLVVDTARYLTGGALNEASAPVLLLFVFAFGIWMANSGLKEASQKGIHLLAKRLTIVAAFFCVFNAAPVVLFEIENQARLNNALKTFRKIACRSKAEISRPDVYYIVIDAFANNETLKSLYGYDNSEFLEHLESIGFFVAGNSKSNHDRTNLSVTSSLKFQLMTPLESLLGREQFRPLLQLRLLQNSLAAECFRKHGYKFYNVCSGWGPTDFIPGADRNLKSSWGNEFNLALLSRTAFGALESIYPFLGNEYRRLRVVPYQRVDEIAGLEGPKFVLFHTLLVHPPFIFDERGGPIALSPSQLSEKYSRKPYLAQLKYCQSLAAPFIDRLMEKTGGKAIIIVQSDHGPYTVDWHQRKQYVNERMRILNAYYFPDGNPQINDSITPVNTFRIVLNRILGTSIPLEKDRSYAAFPPDFPLHFEDVTGLIEGSTRQPSSSASK